MYKEIVELRPYFHSLREFNTDVSFDLKLPLSWEITFDESIFKSVKLKEQDKNEKTKLVSYISPKTEAGYKEVIKCVKHIITYNLEKERKERLLEEKIKELKKLFQEKDLELLENLKFEELYGRERTEGIGLSDTEGYTEDSEGTSGGEEETD